MTLQSLRVGDQLEGGRFVIGPLLGTGGMGQVYRAYDRRLERDVALKAMTELAADDLYRLKREFRVLAGFSHPNLVQLYELFASDRHCFFTMELLEGEPLMSHVRGATLAGARLDPDALARLGRAFAQITAALRVLHEAGQVHRDVKPPNVIVMPEARAVLLDFGLTTLGREGFESEDWGFVGTLRRSRRGAGSRRLPPIGTASARPCTRSSREGRRSSGRWPRSFERKSRTRP